MKIASSGQRVGQFRSGFNEFILVGVLGDRFGLDVLGVNIRH